MIDTDIKTSELSSKNVLVNANTQFLILDKGVTTQSAQGSTMTTPASAVVALVANAYNLNNLAALYTGVSNNSANNLSNYTTVRTNSALWTNTSTIVGTNSANWDAAAGHTFLPGTIFVDAINGSNTLGDGSLSKPYSSLQVAYNATSSISNPVFWINGNVGNLVAPHLNLTFLGTGVDHSIIGFIGSSTTSSSYIRANGKHMVNIYGIGITPIAGTTGAAGTGAGVAGSNGTTGTSVGSLTFKNLNVTNYISINAGTGGDGGTGGAADSIVTGGNGGNGGDGGDVADAVLEDCEIFGISLNGGGGGGGGTGGTNSPEQNAGNGGNGGNGGHAGAITIIRSTIHTSESIGGGAGADGAGGGDGGFGGSFGGNGTNSAITLKFSEQSTEGTADSYHYIASINAGVFIPQT